MPRLLFHFFLACVTVVTVSSCSKAAPFSTETFQAIDGQKSIKFISGDELELQDRSGNFVCKYTKQGETLRVTENFADSVRAFYFDITPAGLRQNDGTIFFSPSALAAKREEMRLQRVAEETKQRAAQQRLADLTAKSHKATRVVKTVNVRDSYTFSYQPTGEVTVTDVSIKIRQQRNRKDFAKEYWFGEIGPIAEYSNPDTISFNWGDAGVATESIYTCDNNSGIQLKAALSSAWRAWHAQYAEVKSDFHPR